MKPVIKVGLMRRALRAASRLLAVLVRVVVPWRAGRDFFRRESGFIGWARSGGDAGVGMWLVGLSAGWVGAGGGGWGMRRMDAGGWVLPSMEECNLIERAVRVRFDW